MTSRALTTLVLLAIFFFSSGQSENPAAEMDRAERADARKKAKKKYKKYREQTQTFLNWKTKRGEQLGYAVPKMLTLNRDLHIADTISPFDELFILKLAIPFKDTASLKVDSVFLFSADVPYRRYHERRKQSAKKMVFEEYLEPRNTDKILLQEDDRVRYKRLQVLFPRIVNSEFEPEIKVGQDKENKIYYFVVNPLSFDSRYRLEVHYEGGDVENYFISTIAQSQKDRVARSISGEFGVLATGLPNAYALTYTASISLVPMNRSIPVKHYSYLSLQRTSIDFGVTINSLAEEGVIGDLIGSSNVFLGFGYKITDGLRFSSGYLFYERVNSNPFSSDTSTDSTLYTGVTIDANVKSLIAGVLGAVGIK